MSKLSLGVEKAARSQLLGPADLRDQRWLDERIADIDAGLDAVVEIAANWLEGRKVSRLHPGVSVDDGRHGRRQRAALLSLRFGRRCSARDPDGEGCADNPDHAGPHRTANWVWPRDGAA